MPIAKIRSAEPLSRGEFERRLSAWLTGSNEETIGEVGSYGGKPWLWVRTGAGKYHLNADTRRDGVEQNLRLLGQDPNLSWTVTAGRSGKMTKVLFGRRMVAIPGFYLYRKA